MHAMLALHFWQSGCSAPASPFPSGPSQCVCTVQETGLTGAFSISPSLVQGRTMLNLDTEVLHVSMFGCLKRGGTGCMLQILERHVYAHYPTRIDSSQVDTACQEFLKNARLTVKYLVCRQRPGQAMRGGFPRRRK